MASIRLGEGVHLPILGGVGLVIYLDGSHVVRPFDLHNSVDIESRLLLVLLTCSPVATVSRHSEHLRTLGNHEPEQQPSNRMHCYHVHDV